MLRIIQCSSAGHAKGYFAVSDYYTRDQELAGLWGGKGAGLLGLSGTVDQKSWDALCDNLHPQTGKPLTVRRKEQRRTGYDFNFHVPKSLSLLHAMTNDPRLLDAFTEAVNQTMAEMEQEMQTRMRRRGTSEDRTTGNMVWGHFTHLTARPVDGLPDPHLHAHVFVQNVTFDSSENRWKAGQFADLVKDAPYFEARFHARLARGVQQLGIPVDRTRNAWEISGLSRQTLEKFSRRTDEIDQLAQKLGITSAQQKAELGGTTRKRKQKNLSMDELRRHWRAMLSGAEISTLETLAARVGTAPIAENTRDLDLATRQAIDHTFERKSVVSERQLLAEAIKRSVGKTSADVAEKAVMSQNLIVRERKGKRYLTTTDVLAQEKKMLAFARDGRGTCRPLVQGPHRFRNAMLNTDQRTAIERLISSRDRVTILAGQAGTGKTTALTETMQAIESAGTRVFTFAPSADATGVLQREGFTNANTIARLLVDQKLQEQMRESVLLIDEAGLLGVRSMSAVFDLADKLESRLILVGDTMQHGSVERGAALRLLQTDAGLAPATLKEIQRQKADYKKAVAALAQGHSAEGFRQLDQLGWIRELPESERYMTLAADYISAVVANKSTLVISPTHAEGDKITRAIRQQLREQNLLGQERSVTVLQNVHLTEAERRDAVNYSNSHVIEFHQNAVGFTKGKRVIVDGSPLPLEHAKRFAVYSSETLGIAPGDRVRATKGGTTRDGKHRVNNGTIFTVKNFDTAGDLVMTNGWTLSKDYGHLSHGFCVTSHASQGSTVDRVFIAQSADSAGASSREQFYVSVSRSREQATVYTDDKTALLAAVSRGDERLSATELVADHQHLDRAVTVQRIERAARMQPDPRPRDIDRKGISHER